MEGRAACGWGVVSQSPVFFRCSRVAQRIALVACVKAILVDSESIAVPGMLTFQVATITSLGAKSNELAL